MALFNMMVGLAVGIAGCIPVFFIHNKWARTIVVIVALAFGIVAIELSNAYLYPHYLGWRFENEIKKQPLFSLIEQYYPNEFKQFINNVKRTIGEKEEITNVSALSAQMVNKIFYQSMRQAPDDYIALYLKATLDLYHYLNSQNPQAVVKLENGDKSSPVDLSAFYERKDFQTLLNHLLDTKRYIIEAGAKTPVPPPSDEQAEPILQGIINDLSNKYGDNVVNGAFSPGPSLIPANVSAQIIIEFYANILGQGRDNAGIIMRHIADLKVRSSENHPPHENKKEETKKAEEPLKIH